MVWGWGGGGAGPGFGRLPGPPVFSSGSLVEVVLCLVGPLSVSVLSALARCPGLWPGSCLRSWPPWSPRARSSRPRAVWARIGSLSWRLSGCCPRPRCSAASWCSPRSARVALAPPLVSPPWPPSAVRPARVPPCSGVVALPRVPRLPPACSLGPCASCRSSARVPPAPALSRSSPRRPRVARCARASWLRARASLSWSSAPSLARRPRSVRLASGCPCPACPCRPVSPPGAGASCPPLRRRCGNPVCRWLQECRQPRERGEDDVQSLPVHPGPRR